jgi:hypothetical protein
LAWIKWLGWGVVGVVGIYLAIVILFTLYFALASYIPLFYRKVARLLRRSARRPDARA